MGSTKSFYTDSDIDFIETYYNRMKAKEIALKLGYTERQIIRKAQSLGIKKTFNDNTEMIDAIDKAIEFIKKNNFKTISDAISFYGCKWRFKKELQENNILQKQ